MSLALVTGATGLVGSHLVEYLVARGVKVRALVRPTSDISLLQSLTVDIVTVRTIIAFDNALFREVTWVFHLAGYLRATSAVTYASRGEQYSDNVILTEKILQGALRAEAKHFVYLSSVSVYSQSA